MNKVISIIPQQSNAFGVKFIKISSKNQKLKDPFRSSDLPSPPMENFRPEDVKRFA